MREATIAIACPHVPAFEAARHDEPDACGAEVAVRLGYTPPDPHAGAGAGGDPLGVYVDGYWSVWDIAPRCTAGHELTADERRAVEAAAREEAIDYGRY